MISINIVCPHCGASFDKAYDPENPGNVVVECTGCRTSLSIVNYLSAEMNREFYARQREARMRKQAHPVKMKLGLPSLTHPVAPEESGARGNQLERRPINQPKPMQMRSAERKPTAGHTLPAQPGNEIIVEDNPPPPQSKNQPQSLAATAQHEMAEGQNTTAVVGPYVATAFGDAKIVNPKPLLVGEFGPFQIEAEISRGGMGAVYRAIDTRATDPLQKCVALKVLLSGPAATPEEMSRFKREALAHGKLSHPNLVMVYDAGEIDGRQYIAMELIQGQSLDKLIRLKPMTTHETLQTMVAVAQAMASAHEQGIIHRDLKPANILIDQMNNPKITDFGLARNLEEITRTTRSGMVMGTPAYMSPEQAEGKSDIGPETDVWSLGTVMYEMLTGKPPFYGDTAIRLALRITQDEPRSPRNLNPEIPMEVEAIVLRCLRKDPA
ncbi:MAG TPA: serine/threonine-protein kinase, partial [Planctomycetota bacterium]|nr:serine/threonine-protein kinase [Planctomycetota bacterium]